MEGPDRKEENELSFGPSVSSPEITRSERVWHTVTDGQPNNFYHESIGFIGLGAMGKPMVLNLARKYPKGTKIHIHDLNASVLNELCALHPTIFVRQADAINVADNAVRACPPLSPPHSHGLVTAD